MTHYEQAMKHSRNHRKDRHCQQCGFSLSGSCQSGAAFADLISKKYRVENVRTREALSPFFNKEDDAVDFLISIDDGSKWLGIYTEHGLCVAR